MDSLELQIVGIEHAAYPQQLTCAHGCTYLIQIVQSTTKDVVMEFCPLSAEQFAGALLQAIELCHRSA